VHEARLLSLSIEKARALLDWRPVWGFHEAVRRSVTWYHERHILSNPNMSIFTARQIQDYANAAAEQDLAWAD
jgi:CDP-glucose 4,6-dehydratase